MVSNRGSAFKFGECPVTHGFTKRGMIQPVYCGQWKCEKCRKRLSRDWANRARKQVNNDPENVYFFWTLTMHRKISSKAFAYGILPQLWDTLRKHIQRTILDSGNPHKWQYLAFVEGQPKRNHMPHFHIVSSVPFPGRIKDFAATHGWGYQAKETAIDGNGVAEYVSKYVSKGDADMPKGFRRCRPSRGWAKLARPQSNGLLTPKKGERDWEFWVRVSDETGKSIEVIRSAWVRATREKLTDDD